MARVLIIDDEKSVRITLKEFLLLDNHQVAILEGAEGALNILHGNNFDIVISDLILPRVNGISLLKEIHEQFPDIELIIISGEPTINTATEAIRLGVFDYLPKPVSMKRIRQVVANAAKVKWLKDTKRALEEENRIYRENLETLVAERTSELLNLNQSLEKEVKKRKSAENEQRLANERLEIITDGIPALIAYVGSDEHYLYVNSSYAEWLNVGKDSLIGQPLSEHLPDDVYQIFEPQIQKVLTGQRASFRFNYNDSNLKPQIIRCEFVPTIDESERVSAYYVLIENITVQEKLQKEAVKARQLDSIELVTRNLANDLNNILTVIMGYMGLSLQKTAENEIIYNYLLKSEDAANEAKFLIEQMLTFSDHDIIRKKVTTIDKLIKKTVTFSIEGTAVKADFNLPHDLWPTRLDLGKMNQTMNFLTLNAIEAMPEGGTIRIKAENVVLNSDNLLPLPEGRYIKIEFCDEGGGISDDFIENIFYPQFNIKREFSRFGLATAYQNIKKHDGLITVNSETGRGTCFEIYLPACDDEQHDPVEFSVTEKHPGGRILVMDDEEIILDMVAVLLNKLGYEVDLAQDGSETIAKYKEALHLSRPYKMVIVDLVIPGGLGGRETILKLKELDPEVKAIISSGHYRDPIMQDFKSYGFCGALIKPYILKELETVLSKIA